jgi:hypothetical protein
LHDTSAEHEWENITPDPKGGCIKCSTMKKKLDYHVKICHERRLIFNGTVRKISYVRFFSRHVFFLARIRTENSVLNLRESHFHDFKSSTKYNNAVYMCGFGIEEITNKTFYTSFDLLPYLIKSKHNRIISDSLNYPLAQLVAVGI